MINQLPKTLQAVAPISLKWFWCSLTGSICYRPWSDTSVQMGQWQLHLTLFGGTATPVIGELVDNLRWKAAVTIMKPVETNILWAPCKTIQTQKLMAKNPFHFLSSLKPTAMPMAFQWGSWFQNVSEMNVWNCFNCLNQTVSCAHEVVSDLIHPNAKSKTSSWPRFPRSPHQASTAHTLGSIPSIDQHLLPDVRWVFPQAVGNH